MVVVVDVETGGLDPNQNPLLSIGAVAFTNPNNYSFDSFYGECAPLPSFHSTKEALEVNGIDLEEWKNKPTAGLILSNFNSWLQRICPEWGFSRIVLGGHNPSFDLGFLRTNYKLFGLQCPFDYRTVDLHSVAFSHFYSEHDTKLTSDRIYELLKMKSEPRPHNALNGAKWENEAFRRIILGLKDMNYDE